MTKRQEAKGEAMPARQELRAIGRELRFREQGKPPFAALVLNPPKEALLNELVAGGPVLGTPEPSARKRDPADAGHANIHRHHHPDPSQLESFVRGGLPRPEARRVVRHLLRGCDECRRVVRQVWALGNRRSADSGNKVARKTN